MQHSYYMDCTTPTEQNGERCIKLYGTWSIYCTHNGSNQINNKTMGQLALVSMPLLYMEQLAHEFNCIHDLCYQLYLGPRLHLLPWVKYYSLLYC